MCSRCYIYGLHFIAHIPIYLTYTIAYLNILRISPEFSAVQCISFLSIWARIILRISYVSHRYCSISQRIAAYCKNIVIGGKVGMELGEIGRSSDWGGGVGM